MAPLGIQLLLVAGVVALVALVLATSIGGVGRIAGSLGDAVGGLVGRIVATPLPSATPLPDIAAPNLEAPSDPYTNQPTTTLRGSIPTAAVGDPDLRIRVYDTLPSSGPSVVKEIAVPPTAVFTIPDLTLADGPNDFTVTIVGGDFESEPSAVVTYVLDTEPPKITIAAPKNGTTINHDTAVITGQTQGLSELTARNEANGLSATAEADGDGSFSLSVPIASGPNGITVSAIDPAGNSASTVVTVRRGSGKLTATISASTYRIPSKKLPEPLTVRVTVTDPDGRPLAGASVLITITAPGIPAIVPSPILTNGDGVASYRTTIPRSATVGSGPIVAEVTTTDFGTITVRTTLTIT